MSDKDARFRRLRPAAGDLFEHFGIALEAPAPRETPALTRAIACVHCGWYVARTEATCPICAQPRTAEASR